MGIKDVYAIRDCTVICTIRDDGKRDYGNTVYLEDQDGYKTVCCHLDWFSVKEGDKLKAGDVFGEIGETGYCKGAHLHFGLFHTWCELKDLRGSNAIDPMPYISKFGYPCKTKITNKFGSNIHNPKLKYHEGIDFSARTLR